jgi:DHA2 family methylenomycin A resistance protein-like MFS transporter
MAAIMAANILARRVTAMLGTRMVIALGAAFMAAACLGMLGFTSARSGQPLAAGELIALLAAAGLGVGLIVPAMTSTLLGSVDRSWSGIASGTLTALRQTGSVLGVALFGSLLASLGLIAGLRIALAVSAALALAVAALSTLAG